MRASPTLPPRLEQSSSIFNGGIISQWAADLFVMIYERKSFVKTFHISYVTSASACRVVVSVTKLGDF